MNAIAPETRSLAAPPVGGCAPRPPRSPRTARQQCLEHRL